MALAKRLAETKPGRASRTCGTCDWLHTLPTKDRESFRQWVIAGHPIMQLFDICATDPDNPLPISYTAMRNHVKAGHDNQR